MGYIVALDIGIASVGWAVIDKESEQVIEAGSNLFDEANASENQIRRNMRQGRRLKRRQRTRLNDFSKLWERYNLSIPEYTSTDLVSIKVRALNEKISLDEIYLILYSYLKHRGIAYLEDAEEDVKGNSAYANGLKLNALELETKYPSEIQKERLESIGKFRGQSIIIDENGEKLDVSNVFTMGAYRNEITRVLQTQSTFYEQISDDFIADYLLIFNRKRKYYEGPGNELSRTDYGKYTTRLGEDGKYVTEENIFEKLIGKCSIYSKKYRAAAASYTAQEFNVLNDLNNLTINGRKLEESEKHKIVSQLKVANTVNMRKIIESAIGEKIYDMSGARVDKDDKEEFHKLFETYNKMRKALAEIDVDICDFSREDLDEIGRILTINTDKESILDGFKNSNLQLDDNIIDKLIVFRKKNSSLFNKWHSFSLEIMNELIPAMYEEPYEQMTLLTRMGLMKSRTEEFRGLKYIPSNAISEDIYNPVVRKSVHISLRVLNALMKKYGVLDDVVVEMPRDRNSDEEKKFISDAQKKNKNELEYIQKLLAGSYDIELTGVNYSNDRKLNLKLKLWNEQGGVCPYSGKVIEPQDILDYPEKFEVDHIIPRSISFDDSRSNKVLVYREQNQYKGNQTPYYYLTHSTESHCTYEEFKSRVLERAKAKEYGYSKKKVKNLLTTEDITKENVLQGFINRNINDTRYASRVVLNAIQSFYRANDIGTKVKVIRGEYTHQMRDNLRLPKDRNESYAHHAVDAMLIAYSQMGYEAYHKLQESFIDFETGEILDKAMWDENMSDEVYADYLYGRRWANIRAEITRAEKDVKYWYYVNTKCNRGLCNQTIRGTREYEGKTYKINKLDIRDKNGLATFKKLALSDKERDREKLLVYKHDRQTFDQLLQILEDYADAANPFTQYEKETGDVVRKYAKNHNGPRIDKLKYVDGEVGACIDISHKYGHERNSRKVILESLVPYRMDVYFKDGAFYLIGIKQSDIKCQGEKYVIDEDAYSAILRNEKMISEGQNRSDLQELGYEFRLSFYKNDIIEYEKNGERFRERFLSRTMPKVKNYIETKPIDKAKYEERNLVGLSKTNYIRKYRMDILGNYYPCDKENFSIYC